VRCWPYRPTRCRRRPLRCRRWPRRPCHSRRAARGHRPARGAPPGAGRDEQQWAYDSLRDGARGTATGETARIHRQNNTRAASVHHHLGARHPLFVFGARAGRSTTRHVPSSCWMPTAVGLEVTAMTTSPGTVRTAGQTSPGATTRHCTSWVNRLVSLGAYAATVPRGVDISRRNLGCSWTRGTFDLAARTRSRNSRAERATIVSHRSSQSASSTRNAGNDNGRVSMRPVSGSCMCASESRENAHTSFSQATTASPAPAKGKPHVTR